MTPKQRAQKIARAETALQMAAALLAEVDDDLVSSFDHFKASGQALRARVVRAHTLTESARDTLGA